MIWQYVAVAVVAYLLGAIPSGLWVGRLVKGIDIREYGSGKTGFTNSVRTLGIGPSIIVFVLDAVKGAVPVLLARIFFDGAAIQAVAGFAAMTGHIWPAYVGFRGGRGVLVAFAATTAMMPLLGPLMIVIGLAIALPFRYISLMSVVGSGVMAGIIVAVSLAGRVPLAYGVWGVAAATMIVVLHRDNIQRLRAGTEPKFGQGNRRRPGTGPANSRP
ncbi:MAG: glycerol-3-phosphate 1-O-acyltransferase PlsY [Dehalococcoidia bacterium]